MVASTLVQAVSIDDEVTYIRLKFFKTLLFGSIKNEAFTLATNDATPIAVNDPFETIDPTNPSQYNSIARDLFIFLKPNKLAASTTYVLTINGLQDANGVTFVSDSTVSFTTPAAYDTDYETALPAEEQPVQVKDLSIKRNIYKSVTELTNANINFYIESTDPVTGEWYIEPNYNNGRITVKFSKVPSASFLNTRYITVQRKPIQRNIARWESLDVKISLDTDEPWVYIDIPSYDFYPEAATPSTTTVYTTAGYGYFEEGYKYRIILSKSVGA